MQFAVTQLDKLIVYRVLSRDMLISIVNVHIYSVFSECNITISDVCWWRSSIKAQILRITSDNYVSNDETQPHITDTKPSAYE